MAILSADGRRNVFCFESSLFDVEGLELLMIPPASGCCIYFSAHSENSQSRYSKSPNGWYFAVKEAERTMSSVLGVGPG